MQAINSFCRELSATRSDTLIGLDRLEHHIRGELDAAAPRALAVLHPLKVVLENLAEEQQVTCRVSAHMHTLWDAIAGQAAWNCSEVRWVLRREGSRLSVCILVILINTSCELWCWRS